MNGSRIGGEAAASLKNHSQVEEVLNDQAHLIAELREEVNRTRKTFATALLPDAPMPGEANSSAPELVRSPLADAIHAQSLQIRSLLWELRSINGSSTL